MLISVHPSPYFIFSSNLEEYFDKMIILIAGYAGTGKSTFADMLGKFIQDSERLRFAGKVKEIAKELGWDGQKDRRGRKLLQTIGGEGRYYSDGMIWVNDVIERIKKSDRKIIIIDDFRYPNEYYEIIRVFPWTWTVKIERPLVLEEMVDDLSIYQHPSETALKSFTLWNFIVYNRNLSGLELDARALANQFKGETNDS